MRNADVETAVGLVLEDRPLDLARLAARRPAALAATWGDILLALAAADGIDTGALLDALRPVLRGAGPRRSLDDPLDTDANRAAHWAALCGQAAKLDALKAHGADLRVPNRLGTTPGRPKERRGRRGDRAQPGRPEHQDPRHRRRARQPDRLRALARAGARPRRRRCSAARPRRGRADR